MVGRKKLSADTLFHFTSTLDNLLSILTNDFYPRYSIEDWSMLSAGESVLDDEIAIPMVCFCDIPLSQIQNHVSYYGHYAIGLKKEWGTKNKVSPVLYCYEHSSTTESLIKIRNKDNLSEDIFYDFINILKFTKPYEGKLYKKNRTVNKVRFYDEREWRYVPSEEIRAAKSTNESLRVSL